MERMRRHSLFLAAVRDRRLDPAAFRRGERQPAFDAGPPGEDHFQTGEPGSMRISLVALHFAEYASRLALALAERYQVQLILRVENARDELSQELLDQLEQSVNLRFMRV